jgi:uncharacterized protein YvpB
MVRRGGQYWVNNSNAASMGEYSFYYGNPDDVVLVGDWDGDGIDTLIVRRGGQYWVNNKNANSMSDYSFYYGNPEDKVLIGDWDGDGRDTIGVVRGANFQLRNATTTGAPDIVFDYGVATDTAFAGDFNGDGRDTVGLRRATSSGAASAGASSAANTPKVWLNVAYISQMPELPTGCEATALAMVINYAGGGPVTKQQIAAEIPSSADPNKGFQGNPATYSGGVVYPPALIPVMAAHRVAGDILTGFGWATLAGYLDTGRPVAAWIRPPGYGSHTVVLIGYNATTVWVHDPIEGANQTWPLSTFLSWWQANGGRALSYS